MGADYSGRSNRLGNVIMGLLNGANAALQGYNLGQERRRAEEERRRKPSTAPGSGGYGLQEKLRTQFRKDTTGPELSVPDLSPKRLGAGGNTTHFGLAPGWLGPLSLEATGTGAGPGFLARLRGELVRGGPTLAATGSAQPYPLGSDAVARYVGQLQASDASPYEVSTAVSRRFGGKWT